MDAIVSRTEPEMLFDLAGRVRNLSLPATPANSLIPLFEAISNAIHAVETRWGQASDDRGEVTITIHRRTDDEDDSHVTGFTVQDNGCGLTSANWDFFRTSDSPYKAVRGGKGVGRLSWLKAFKNCRVTSHFEADGVYYERKFGFSLREFSPIQDHVVEEKADGASTGTAVYLDPFDTAFEVHCPKKTVTIASKVVGHFLPYFVLARHPKMVIVDAGEFVDLAKFYAENQQRSNVDVLSIDLDLIDNDKQFHVYHVLLRKHLRFLQGGYNWMFYAGNERVAKEENIDNQLGLRTIGDEGESVYVGLVAGPFLDSHVNQERTSFTFSSETAGEIYKVALASAKAFLGDHIERIRRQQIETAATVIRNNPQFLPFREDLSGFVANHLSLNTQGEENIFVELSRQKFRGRRRLDGQLHSLRQSAAGSVEADVQQVTKALNDEKKSALAEYVVRRKAILELFGLVTRVCGSKRTQALS